MPVPLKPESQKAYEALVKHMNAYSRAETEDVLLHRISKALTAERDKHPILKTDGQRQVIRKRLRREFPSIELAGVNTVRCLRVPWDKMHEVMTCQNP